MLAIAGAAVLFVAGVAVGVGGQSTETITTTETEIRVRTETRTKTETVVETVRVNSPAAPNQQGISVNYGQWAGLFRLSGLNLASEYGYYSIVGTFEYLGGSDCEPGYLSFSATVYRGGQVIDTALWNDVDNPKSGVRYPFEMSLGETRPDRVEVVMTDASCA